MRLHLDTSTSVAASNIQDTAQTAAGSGSTRAGSRSPDSSPGRDSISVSSLSSALNGISSQRGDRIAQLTAAVRSGQYQVPSATISSAIVGGAIAGSAIAGSAIAGSAISGSAIGGHAVS